MKTETNRYGQVLFVVGVIAAQMVATWGFAASSTVKVDLYSDSMQVKNSETEVPKSLNSSGQENVTITRSSAEMNSGEDAESAPVESMKELKNKKIKRK